MKRRMFINRTGLIISGGFLSFKLGKPHGHDNAGAQKAWSNLVGNNVREQYKKAFEYVENRKDLKNVFIYGDSISIGYTPYVRENLDKVANVYRLHKNGTDSSTFIRKMEQMNNAMAYYWDFSFDVIHFNVGLHDIKYLFNGKLDNINGKQVTEINKYRDNLVCILDWLQLNYPKSKLIFASTTPVPTGTTGWYAGDEVKYNKAAFDVLEKYPGVIINDLWTFVKPNFEQWTVKEGNVHYNEFGKKQQGKQISEIIKNLL